MIQAEMKAISPQLDARVQPLNLNPATAFSLSSPNEERDGVRSRMVPGEGIVVKASRDLKCTSP
jgi:hypothetical protein